MTINIIGKHNDLKNYMKEIKVGDKVELIDIGEDIRLSQSYGDRLEVVVGNRYTVKHIKRKSMLTICQHRDNPNSYCSKTCVDKCIRATRYNSDTEQVDTLYSCYGIFKKI